MAGLLEGLKVADFTWAAVGPIIARYLANFGATVVKVETSSHLDITRQAPPFAGGKTHLDRSGYFSHLNSSKLSLGLNLNHPRGREVARHLIAWSDVVLESFAPGVMKRWGLGYEDIVKFKPDILMLSTSNLGQTGPHAQRTGFGTQLVSLAGFTHITGWGEGAPNHPYGAYTDLTAPLFGTAALLSALDYHRRTGRGQHLDLSQVEASLHFLAPLLLDYFVNGRVAGRQGNRDLVACPHSVFPCTGEDRWVAIAVETEAEWQALCQAMGEAGLAADPRFRTREERQRNEAELEELIASWTRRLSREEVVERLQALGVPAGPVQDAHDLMEDPQLRERGYFVKLEHREMGPVSFPTPSFILPKSPPRLRPSPCLGEHTEYVCRELLGMGDEELATLLAEGVLE